MLFMHFVNQRVSYEHKKRYDKEIKQNRILHLDLSERLETERFINTEITRITDLSKFSFLRQIF